MNKLVKIALITFLALDLGIAVGFFLASSYSNMSSRYGEIERTEISHKMPEDLLVVLDRFILVNRATNQTLEKYMMLGGAQGVYEENGDTFETFVLSFEDRYGGAEADNDFLDVIIEFKRVMGESSVTVRMAQLGLDNIEVYLDDELIGSIRPSIEILVKN